MNSLSIFSPSFADSILDAFDQSFKSDISVFAPTRGAGLPSVDIRELDSAYIMEADLPGFSEKDIDINIKDRVMTLSSLKETEKEENGEKADYIIKERNVMHFVRRFSLPEDIETEKVTADFENGVLTVNIPRKAETQPRQITINRK